MTRTTEECVEIMEGFLMGEKKYGWIFPLLEEAISVHYHGRISALYGIKSRVGLTTWKEIVALDCTFRRASPVIILSGVVRGQHVLFHYNTKTQLLTNDLGGVNGNRISAHDEKRMIQTFLAIRQVQKAIDALPETLSSVSKKQTEAEEARQREAEAVKPLADLLHLIPS